MPESGLRFVRRFLSLYLIVRCLRIMSPYGKTADGLSDSMVIK